MGVDSFIFDEVSKDCLYFDRKIHFFTYGTHDAVLQEIFGKMDATYKKGQGLRATSDEVIYACQANLQNDLDGCHNEGHQDHWNTRILLFALKRPDGRFFSASDHDYEYDHDIIEADGYRIVGYDKDMNEVEGLL